MIKLESKDFKKVAHLVKSQNELSIFAVINGNMPGEIYVNNIETPTAALIQTGECNLITGNPNDEVFNSEVSTELDFWDALTPDSDEWIDKIPTIHQNSFIRKYKRRHYQLTSDQFVECKRELPEGFAIEKVDLASLKQNTLENSQKILNWVEAWGDDDRFQTQGTGYYIHNNQVIVSWSLSDCSFDKTIAIGIHTDEGYRNKGFGKIVVSATIKDSFAKGYEKIDWLCVDSNKGSIAIAEKLGFTHKEDYYSFSSYPPIENPTDLSEAQWHEWGEYLEEASKSHDCLMIDCLFSYVKANDVEKAMDILKTMKLKEIKINYLKLKNHIIKLLTYGMCSNFHDHRVWIDFIDGNM